MKLGDIIKIITKPGFYGGDYRNNLAIFIRLHEEARSDSLYEVLTLKNMSDKLFLYDDEFKIMEKKNERQISKSN